MHTAYHALFRKMSFQDTILERSYRTQSLEYRLAFIELISIEKALNFDLRLDFGFKICFPLTAPYIIDLQRHVCIVIMFSYVFILHVKSFKFYVLHVRILW